MHLRPEGVPSCARHRKRREAGRLVPCAGQRIRGLEVCRMHVGKKLETAKAEGRRNVERAEAIEEIRHRLGVEAPDEPSEVTALREIRKARNDLAVYQSLVDGLIDDAGGDLLVLAVSTGNEKKPNEVEKHFWLARRDEERDRLMAWLATARKLGIEEARLEQQERIAQADAERITAVIRMSLEASKVALLAAGAAKELIDRWYREEVPAIVARAIDATSTEVTPA